MNSAVTSSIVRQQRQTPQQRQRMIRSYSNTFHRQQKPASATTAIRSIVRLSSSLRLHNGRSPAAPCPLACRRRSTITSIRTPSSSQKVVGPPCGVLSSSSLSSSSSPSPAMMRRKRNETLNATAQQRPNRRRNHGGGLRAVPPPAPEVAVSSAAMAVGLLGTAICWTALLGHSLFPNDDDDGGDGRDNVRAVTTNATATTTTGQQQRVADDECDTASATSSPPSSILATSSSVVGDEDNGAMERDDHDGVVLNTDPDLTHRADFVVVGYGNAGQEAVRTLRKECPEASIMVIDPLTVPSAAMMTDGGDTAATKTSNRKRRGYRNGDRKDHRVLNIVGSALGLDHDKKTVLVFASNVVQGGGGPPTPGIRRVRFDQSVLIATGSRGAPPPQALVEDRVMDRILELKSTGLLSLHQYYSFLVRKFRKRRLIEDAGDTGTTTNNNDTEKEDHGSYPRYPILPPRGVREIVLMAASQGARVCILGSGIEALELAATCVFAKDDAGGGGGGGGVITTNSSSNQQHSGSVSLVFGSPSPLSTTLPRYLCTAVSKRLRGMGLQIDDRSLVRYVSYKQEGDKDRQDNAVEVHIEKWYDKLDTQRRTVDLVVVAPSRDGLRGSAVIPTLSSASSTTTQQEPQLPQLQYSPWSKLTPSHQPILSCYEDDGRIVVNSELLAASDIYAAGSVAKYPNLNTGHAEVAGSGGGGGGGLKGSVAGGIAANNMARDYYQRRRGGDYFAIGRRGTSLDNRQYYSGSSRCISLKDSLAVWSTDQSNVNNNNYANKDFSSSSSALSRVGINALCVGHCDSGIYGTHGFWWTNQGRRQSNNQNSRLSGIKPVYGSGVVYYLDRDGTIRGVMVWGLPFTTTTNHNNNTHNTMNERLVQRMKDIILTNGEIMVKGHTSVILEKQRMDKQQDPDKLQVAHLSEESRCLASIAFSPSSPPPYSSPSRKQQTQHNTSPQSDIFIPNGFRARPLYRFVSPKPISYTSLGRLKRQSEEIGYGSIGEDIFVRRENAHEAPYEKKKYDRHPSLVYYASMDSSSGGDIFGNFDDTNDKNDVVELEELEYDARPSKEEPLWKRQSENNKTQSINDILSDLFTQNIRKGQFMDGSDAVKQAPVPAFFQEARDVFNGWQSPSPPPPPSSSSSSSSSPPSSSSSSSSDNDKK